MTDCKCGTKFCKHNKAQVWSCGGGTQSCAIAALIVQGKLPKPDFSVIADTGYETGATWEFMDRVLVPELAKVGVELRRIKTADWNPKRASLFHNYVITERRPDVIIPAYSSQEARAWTDPETGTTTWYDGVSKLKNWCTGRWKVESIDAYLSDQGIKRKMCVKWIGFSRDEQRRIVSMQCGEEFKEGLIRFPLLECRMTRKECVDLVQSMGWGTPPRSACYMCPNHSDHEWRKLKAERPDEFQKAVELEREIHKVNPDAWLHRSCIPLDQVDFSQPEDLFSRPCDSGMCFV